MPILITDIDHTLAHSSRRDHLEGRWDEYNADAINDDPVHDTIAMVRSLKRGGWWVVALTGRPEKWRELTMRWLVVNEVPVDSLVMRPSDCYDPAPKMKVAQAQKIVEASAAGVIVIDDRLDVIEAFRDAGLTTLHVRVARVKRSYEHHP